MYMRLATLADLAGEALGLSSRTELCNRLNIAIPTLNAYRAGTRFPDSVSPFIQNLARLMSEAYDRVVRRPGESDLESGQEEWNIRAYLVESFRLEYTLRDVLRILKATRKKPRTKVYLDAEEIASHVALRVLIDVLDHARIFPRQASPVSAADVLRVLPAVASVDSAAVALLWLGGQHFRAVVVDDWSVPIASVQSLKRDLERYGRCVVPAPLLYDIFMICCSDIGISVSCADSDCGLTATSITGRQWWATSTAIRERKRTYTLAGRTSWDAVPSKRKVFVSKEKLNRARGRKRRGFPPAPQTEATEAGDSSNGS